MSNFESVARKWHVIKKIEEGPAAGVSLHDLVTDDLKEGAVLLKVGQLMAAAFPINEVYSSQDTLWRLDSKLQASKVMQFSPSEIVRYNFFKDKLLKEKTGTHIELISKAIQSIAKDLGPNSDDFTTHYLDLIKHDLMLNMDPIARLSRFLEELTNAAVKGQKIRVNYIASTAGKTSAANVEPHRLLFHDGNIFLIARDPIKAEFRIFDMCHMTSVDTLVETFTSSDLDAFEIYKLALARDLKQVVSKPDVEQKAPTVLPQNQAQPIVAQVPPPPEPVAPQRTAGAAPAVIDSLPRLSGTPLIPPVAISPGKDNRHYDVPAARSKTLPSIPIPQSTNDSWFVLTIHNLGEDKNYGKVRFDEMSTDQVREKLVSRDFYYSDLIWKNGYENWVCIGAVDDFDRRRPMDFETQPKPEVSYVIPLKKFAGNPEFSRLSVPVPEKSEENSVTSFGRKRKSFDYLTGALAVLCLVVAVGILHQNYEDKEAQLFKILVQNGDALAKFLKSEIAIRREVAAVSTPIKEVPVNAAPFLKIVGDGLENSPRLLLSSNLRAGTKVEIEISAQSGTILDYASFYLKKEITITDEKNMTINLTDDHLPQGHYEVLGHTTDTTAFLFIDVGVLGSDFKAKLDVFRNKLANQIQIEKNLLLDGTQFLSMSIVNVPRDFSSFKTQKNTGTKKWNTHFANWMSKFNKEFKKLEPVSEANRNDLYYPSQLLKLKKLEQSILNFAKLSNSVFKTDSANETESLNAFKNSIQEELKLLTAEILALNIIRIPKLATAKPMAAAPTLPPSVPQSKQQPASTANMTQPKPLKLLVSKKPLPVESVKKLKRVVIDFSGIDDSPSVPKPEQQKFYHATRIPTATEAVKSGTRDISEFE